MAEFGAGKPDDAKPIRQAPFAFQGVQGWNQPTVGQVA